MTDYDSVASNPDGLVNGYIPDQYLKFWYKSGYEDIISFQIVNE